MRTTHSFPVSGASLARNRYGNLVRFARVRVTQWEDGGNIVIDAEYEGGNTASGLALSLEDAQALVTTLQQMLPHPEVKQ